MEEKVHTLVEEGPRGHKINGGSVGIEALARWSEPAKRIVRCQTDGSYDGDVGLELWPTELAP